MSPRDSEDQPTVPPPPSVLDQIRAVTGAKPMVSLRDASSVGTGPILKPLDPVDHLVRETGKYVIHGLLGRGGVGAVHRGHDTELGRDVAMKFLHDRFRDRPEVLHRFVEEAQIGGQLQHPGIVPVYDLGMQDGRPFFTMKLVKGKTLAQLLSDRASPGDDRRRFLVIFEQMCQTMAYAHARGVVHRDLKPANIMIGAFGEVQVVDWGVGKVLERGGVADEKRAARRHNESSVIETVRSAAHGTDSVIGSVMGTPAYMPPEQAMGDVDQMDERSDVFSLGAILCEILTGRPPYVGEPDMLIGSAAMAKLAAAHERLEQCGAEPDLIELTKQCLMPEPVSRPRSAAVVAAGVQAHLARAEQRAHQATVRAAALKRTQKLVLVTTVMIGAALAASLWFWRDAEAQRTVADAQRTVADAQRTVADSQRTVAEKAAANARLAHEMEAAARATAETSLANFNRLAHVVRLENAKATQKTLHPPWPERAPALRAWLEREANPLRDALPELRATLAALQARALPQTDVELAAERRTHPRAAELTSLQRELRALEREHAVRTGAKLEPFALDATVPKSAPALNALAWLLANPERTEFGREAEALALARRAAALAPAAGNERATVLDTLAWALLANGLDGEARQRSNAALAAAEPDKQAEYAGYREKLEAAIAAAGSRGQAAIDQLSGRVRALEVEIAMRRQWSFPDDADQFLHATLRALVADLEAFEDNEIASVEARLRWAERVEQLTVTRYRDRWSAARLALRKADGVTASRLYAARPIELKPQTGLVPIGMNPVTRLWEFYHLRSAWGGGVVGDPSALEIPQHREDGTLDMEQRGLVFVLIPGGSFFMGTQTDDADGPNHEAGAPADEMPVGEIDLAPYLLSKYELTQGQWARLAGGEYPSWYRLGRKFNGIPVPIGDTHPVEQVSWTMSDALLAHYGLALPTEAQWERGARGGTSTAWSCGAEPGSLAGFANVLDRTGETVAPVWVGGEAFDDGFKGPAPVGTYSANGFGLHDAHGNVWEWCRDRHGSYAVAPRSEDGLRDPGDASVPRVARGGSYHNPARSARSGLRNHYEPTTRTGVLGVRPTRVILP